MKNCPPDKILNPLTNRCVLRTGAIGKKILAKMNAKSAKGSVSLTPTVKSAYKSAKGSVSLTPTVKSAYKSAKGFVSKSNLIVNLIDTILLRMRKTKGNLNDIIDNIVSRNDMKQNYEIIQYCYGDRINKAVKEYESKYNCEMDCKEDALADTYMNLAHLCLLKSVQNVM
jgi:hypothetical protein